VIPITDGLIVIEFQLL